jgi:hypothetical protein
VNRFKDDVVRDWLEVGQTIHGNTCGVSPEIPASVRGLKVIDCVERVVVPFNRATPFVTLGYVGGSMKEASQMSGNKIPTQPPKVIALMREHC